MKAGKWKEADQETAKQMCQVMGRQSEGRLRVEDIEKFPCVDLRAIDQLWVQHSNGKFGFSVQKKIWQQCGSPTAYNKQWEKFGEAVGWRSGNRSEMKWTSLSIFDRNFDPSSAPEGYLPSLPSLEGYENVLFRGGYVGVGVMWVVGGGVLFSRAKICKL